MVSVTQVNESGLLYSLDELKAIGAFAKEKKLVMHMDGARFGNAVEGIGCSPADMTWRSGVDVLSFGATKNGCMASLMTHTFLRARTKNLIIPHSVCTFRQTNVQYIIEGLKRF